jgi:GNAT superfamily N-acetyltransferase
MRIRRLTTGDYRSVRDIFHDAFDKENLSVTDLGISWRNRSHPYSYGVFTGSGELVAFAIISFHKRNGDNRYIDYIAVHSAYRGCGYGDILMRQILRTCWKEHRGVHLYPLRYDSLLKWYRKYGFYETDGKYLNFHSYQTRQQVRPPFLEEE